MIADSRNQLVERYLAGAMGPEESRSFLARAGRDPELGRLLEAERVIAGAIARDRAATIPASTVPGGGLMAALEHSRSGAIVRPVTGALVSTKVAAVLVGLVALVAGALYVAPLLGDRDAALQTPGMNVRDADAQPAARESLEPQMDARETIGSSSDGVSTNAASAEASRMDASSIEASSADDLRGSREETSRSDRSGGVLRGAGAASREARSANTSPRTARESSTSRSGDAQTSSIDERSTESLPQYDDTAAKIEIKVEQGKQ